MNAMLLLLTLAAPFGAASAPAAAPGPRLGLDDYLGQVEGGNPALQSARKSSKGFDLRKFDGTVVTSPYVFGLYQKLDDKKETPTPTFQGTRTRGNQFSVGLGANTAVGLSAKYTFNVTKTEIQGATPAFLPQSNYYTTYNQLELTQSLFRNGFGSETSAQVTALNAGNLAQSYAEGYRAQAQLVESENAYWRLAFARRTVKIQKEVLERADKILAWAKKRVAMQLGDRADLLQAQASYDLRRLELRSAEEEATNAARSFNLLRGRPGESVPEALDIPNPKSLLQGALPARTGKRLDVLAAEQQEKAAIASAQLDKEKAKPNLDLFASMAWNGRDGRRPEAIEEAMHAKHSTLALGVKFTAPLAIPTMRNTWKGTELAKEAATLTLDRKHLDEEQEWSELLSRLKDARARLSLLQAIESVQREKFENERQRLLRGRTTTYQALTFEQDYAQAQLLRIRTQAEVLRLTAQSRLYGGEL